MGRGQRGGGGGGSQNYSYSASSESKSKETTKRRHDFSVEVVFSSLPYYVYCGWKSHLFVDKRKPYVAESSLLNMCWSSPKGNGYGPCKETIFIDCSLNDINTFSNGKTVNLTRYLGFAITRLKDLMDQRSKENCYGTVNINIIAIHPCQKLMFALAALLGTKLDDSGVYTDYVSQILSKDEYFFTFRWIQQKGWEMKVKYCALFDAYKGHLEDTRGAEDREKELKRIIDNHKRGEDKVMYDGKKVPFSYVEEEYRKMTDPTSAELKKNYEEQCKNVEAVERDAERQRSQLRKAEENAHAPYDRKRIEIENLRNSSPEYKNKNDAELTQILQNGGLIDFQSVKWKKINYDQYGQVYTGGHEAAMGLNEGEDKHAPVYMVDGAPLDARGLSNRQKDLDQQVADAKAARDAAKKAYDDKLTETFDTVFGVMQLAITVGSLAFPPLTLIDAAITVGKWVAGPECSTAENVANGMGLAMDIAGLIPYFGTVVKVTGKAAIGTAKVVGKQATKKILKGLGQEIKVTGKQGSSLTNISKYLTEGSAKQIRGFFKSQKDKLAGAVETAVDAAGGVSTVYTVAVGIGYNGSSFLIGLLSDFEFDPNVMKKKKKAVEQKRKEKPKYKSLSIQDKSLDGNKELSEARRELEKAKKSGDKEAIDSAKRRVEAAERLQNSQFEADLYSKELSIKGAEKNLYQAQVNEMNAKTLLERQQRGAPQAELAKLQSSNSLSPKVADRITELNMEVSNNYLYPDANRLNYEEAKLEKKAAEEALAMAKEDDYYATMARINAQFATQDLNYEKSRSDKKSK